jgi:hypothetical protein
MGSMLMGITGWSASVDCLCGPERGGKGLEEVVAGAPFACWGGPVQGVGTVGASEDIPVQHMDQLAILVISEFPVSGSFSLRVVHRLEADPVVTRISADPAGFLLAPIGQRIRLGMLALVDDQESAAARVLDMHEMANA